MRPALHVAAALAIIALAALTTPAASAIPHHELHVRLNPENRQLLVRDTIALETGDPIRVRIGGAYRVTRATVDGRPVESLRGDDAVVFDIRGLPKTAHRFEIEYEGTIEALRNIDHRGTLQALPPMAGPKGSYLPAGSSWHPQAGESAFTYRVLLELPKGQRGVVPGRLLEESDGPSGYVARFEFLHPADGIELMAAPYVIGERFMRAAERQVRLRTWFHPEIAESSAAYLDSVEAYLRAYEAQIGPYPFSEFSVVSAPLPTGFGMPGLTYLGVEVLRLPFIRSTSLGHEVLHNWWGNGVRADYASGNWAEGLTTFMADYAYQEQANADRARDMRMEWLRDFAAIPAGQDAPLRAFTSRTHGTSQIVGYNKAAFLFFMLRDAIGQDAFYAGLRQFWKAHRFQSAGWADLTRAFEASSGQDLGALFAQWLERRGAPQIGIEEVHAKGSAVHFTLTQTQPVYVLDVPISFATEQGEEHHVAVLRSARASFDIALASPARQAVLDPDFRLFRVLAPSEIPPILRNVIVNPDTRLAVASADPAFAKAAQALAERLLDQSPKAETAIDGRAPLLLIARGDALDAALDERGLPSPPPQVRGKGSAQVWTSRLPSGRVVAVIAARDAALLEALARGLPHYGRQSWLVFDGGKAVERGVGAASSPVVPIPRD